MNIEIREVKKDCERMKFIKSQWNFYKEDPNFVPPIIADRKKVLSREKNPFFQHALMQEFLAYEGKDIVGRIAAIINHNHNQTHNDKVGFFGFFESIDNQQVAKLLFDTAANWLKERGMDEMRGPVDLSMNDEVGLLIEGFDQPPVILMKYNPEYYIHLIKDYGFHEEMLLYAWKLVNATYASDKLNRLQEVIRKRHKITIENLSFKDKKKLREDIQLIKDIYNSAWEKNWGFVKATEAEFDVLAEDFVQIADPYLVLIAKVDGKVAGFALALPDINQALIYNKGGSLLGAAYHLFTKKKKIDTLRVITLGVFEEYRKTGADAVLYWEVANRGLEHGYDKGEASWILSINEEMNNALQKSMHGELYKKYMLYQKKI
jgi:GNAT superfamily N-acetyltransferase